MAGQKLGGMDYENYEKHGTPWAAFPTKNPCVGTHSRAGAGLYACAAGNGEHRCPLFGRERRNANNNELHNVFTT